MKVSPSFGIVMRELRHKKGLSQEELTEKMELSSNAHISRLESGKKNPSLEMVFRIAEILEVRASELIRMIEERDKKD